MGFTRMAFTPNDNGLRDPDIYPAVPASEDEARGQIQGLLDQLKAAINSLMAKLENTDTEVSGAAMIGSEPIASLAYQGASPATIRGQIVALNAKIADAITTGLSISQVIGDKDIKAGMLDDGAVKAGNIASGAVLAGNIASGAVAQGNLGTIQSITLDSGDSLIYDPLNNKVKLRVNGCAEVQLCPVIYSNEENPASDTYPAGTVFIQYVG